MTGDAFDRLALALREIVDQAVSEALDRAGIASHVDDSAEFVSVPEAAQRLRLGQTTVKKLIASGELDSVLVGRRRLVAPESLGAYADRLKVSGCG